MSDFTYSTATEQLQRLRDGEVSSTQLLEQHIARVHAHDDRINAVVVRTFEAARQRAAAADAARQRGKDWGPLHGLPMTVKESFDLPGTPTCWGFPEYKDNIAQQPAVAVQRLLDAGAVIFGKSNVPTFSGDFRTENPVYGRTLHPLDHARSPGGSSGEAASQGARPW